MTTSRSLAIGGGHGPALASPRTHSHVGGHHPASYTTPFGSATSHIMRSLLGTTVRNAWIPSRAIETTLRMFPAPVGADREYVLVIPAERVLGLPDDIVERAFRQPQRRLEELPLSAVVARSVRNVSGLSAERLGDVFPVARETFQRWITGVGHPSTPNLQRLLLLDRFIRDISSRTGDVRVWLLTPVARRADAKTPYDLLREGRLTEAWNLARSAGTPRFERYRDADGNFATRVSGNIAGTLESEDYGYDDFDE